MNARRLLTLIAAVIVTAVQTLIFAADTASSTRHAAPNVAETALQQADRSTI
jgi:beta-lactam-binding protein with PASTA domain